MRREIEKCPNDRPGLELRCHAGYLWELTYSEMGPPDQRQNTGQRCPLCRAQLRVRLGVEGAANAPVASTSKETN